MQMTSVEGIQLITAITALVSAIAGVLAVFGIKVVHRQTNSLVTKLLIEGKLAARAEGQAIGLQQGRDEVRDAGRRE